MDGLQVLQNLQEILHKNENKEKLITNIKQWNVIRQEEILALCLSWCYHFLIERLSNVPLVSDIVARTVKHFEDSKLYNALSAASISLADKGSSEKSKPEAPINLNAESLAEELFTEMLGLCSQDINTKVLPLAHIISDYGHRNRRRTMEDRHVTLPFASRLLNCKQGGEFGYFAVFDGHGGQEAADYAALHFHANLGRHPQCGTDNAEALRGAFKTTDEIFCQHARQDGLHSGTTGVCAVVEWGKQLTVAWLGDSQAILVKKGGEVVSLTEPHKPENEDEKKRIESLGGCVMFFGGWRVNGCLTVSRAIGDVGYKPLISSDAGTRSVDLTGSEDFLVIGCDGLFDTVNATQVRDTVYQHLNKEGGSKQNAASRLVKLAQEEGSTDNITVVVVFFSDLIGSGSTEDSSVTKDTHQNGKRSDDGGEKRPESNADSGNNDNAKSSGNGHQIGQQANDISSTRMCDSIAGSSTELRRISLQLPSANLQLSCVNEEMEVCETCPGIVLDEAAQCSQGETQLNSRPLVLCRAHLDEENLLPPPIAKGNTSRAVTPTKSHLSAKSPRRTRQLSTGCSPCRVMPHGWIGPVRQRALSSASHPTLSLGATTALLVPKPGCLSKRPRSVSLCHHSSGTESNYYRNASSCSSVPSGGVSAKLSPAGAKTGAVDGRHWIVALEVNAAAFFH